MNKKIIFAAVFALAAAVTVQANAQETAPAAASSTVSASANVTAEARPGMNPETRTMPSNARVMQVRSEIPADPNSTSSMPMRANGTGTRAINNDRMVQFRTETAEARADLKVEIKAERAEIKGDVRVNASGTRESSMDKREMLKTQIETRKAEMSNEKIAEKVSYLVTSSHSQLSNALSRLDSIKAKIVTRLEKFEAAGANTFEARADLSSALSRINEAQASVDAIASIQVSAAAPKESAETLRTAVKAAQAAIKEAQDALTKVVSSMKGLGAAVNASATASTSAQQ